jgi:DNA-binding Lrp family transcriptional regulator
MAKREYKLDDIDLQILETLEANGRISNIDLANIVGITPSPCLRRLRALEINGIISNYFTQLNPLYFGYKITVFASLSIKAETPESRQLFENEISNINEITEIYSLSLPTDYLVKITTKTWEEYQILIKVKLLKIPYIAKIRTTQIERTIKKQNKLPSLRKTKTHSYK